MRSLILSLFLVPALMLTSSGAILPIDNGSFESPDISPDTESVTSPSNWAEVTNKGYFHVLFRDGEASDGEQYVEMRTPVDDDSGFDYGLFLDDTTPVVYEADLMYRVSVDVRLGEVTPTGGNVVLRIETPIGQGRDSQTIPSFDIGTDIPDSDNWTTISTPWFTPTLDAVGDNMRIQIQVGNLPNADSGVQFDNVRVEAIPEPTTLSLLGLAALGVLRRRRRR